MVDWEYSIRHYWSIGGSSSLMDELEDQEMKKDISGILINEVCGIIIWTDRLTEMCNFYEKTLGLKIRNKKSNYVNFEWNDFKLTIGKHNKVKGKNKDQYRMMINFSVDNINETYVRLVDSYSLCGFSFLIFSI